MSVLNIDLFLLNGGIYYVIKVQKVGDINKRTMIITDGCIFDKLDKFRLEFTRAKFSFKKSKLTH